MKTNEYMEQTEQYVLHTYNRFPLVIDHGEGVHLYDTDRKSTRLNSSHITISYAVFS